MLSLAFPIGKVHSPSSVYVCLYLYIYIYIVQHIYIVQYIYNIIYILYNIYILYMHITIYLSIHPSIYPSIYIYIVHTQTSSLYIKQQASVGRKYFSLTCTSTSPVFSSTPWVLGNSSLEKKGEAMSEIQ
jgi:hypothetical protein